MKSIHKYSMIVKWDDESDCYIVAVPELCGCMSDGKTPQEAIENVQIIIDEWIEMAKELNMEIPDPSYY